MRWIKNCFVPFTSAFFFYEITNEFTTGSFWHNLLVAEIRLWSWTIISSSFKQYIQSWFFTLNRYLHRPTATFFNGLTVIDIILIWWVKFVRVWWTWSWLRVSFAYHFLVLLFITASYIFQLWKQFTIIWYLFGIFTFSICWG